jgi:hypothetical protein
MDTTSPLQEFERSVAAILNLPDNEQRQLLEGRFVAGDHQPLLLTLVRVGAVRAQPGPRHPDLQPVA